MVGSEPISNAGKAGVPLTASNLLLRVVSAAVLAPLALVAAYIGGLPFALFWGIAALVVLWEWMTLVGGQIIGCWCCRAPQRLQLPIFLPGSVDR